MSERKLQLGLGVTILSILLIFTMFFWDRDMTTITTIEMFWVIIISFGIGLISSLFMRLARIRTNYNLMALVIVAFGFMLYSLGDYPISAIPMSTILSMLLLSFMLAIFLSFILYIFIK